MASKDLASRPVVFIGHSLGGLVIKQVLVYRESLSAKLILTELGTHTRKAKRSSIWLPAREDESLGIFRNSPYWRKRNHPRSNRAQSCRVCHGEPQQ